MAPMMEAPSRFQGCLGSIVAYCRRWHCGPVGSFAGVTHCGPGWRRSRFAVATVVRGRRCGSPPLLGRW